MDPVTHALTGALIARASQPREPQGDELSPFARVTAGTLAAIAPDIDFVERLFGTSLDYLNSHRGVTHSLLLWPLWAWLLALLMSTVTVHRWRSFYAVCLMGVGSHILLDLLTSYGTMIFAPFSDWRVSLPAVFIIDPWFTLIIALGLVLARGRHLRLAARTGLVLGSLYMAMAVQMHFTAMDLGRQQADARGWSQAEVHAFPQPLSPFRQKLILREDETYHIALVNLIGAATDGLPRSDDGPILRILHSYRSPDTLNWQTLERFGSDTRSYSFAWAAWSQPVLEGYRQFAELPVLDEVIASGSEVCAFFIDLRFTIPGVKPAFRYGACHGATGWRLAEPSARLFTDAAHPGS